MSLTYTWKVSELQTTQDGVNFVTSVKWIATGTDASGKSAEFEGVTPFTLDHSKTIVPYNSLTEEQVIQWVKDYIASMKDYQPMIERVITERIAKQSVASVAPPWTPAPNTAVSS